VVEVDGVRVNIRSPLTAARRGLRYVTYDRKGEGLFLEQSVTANITATRLRSLSRLGWLGSRIRRRVAALLAKQTSVRTSGLNAAVKTLSGGNQQKVLIGRGLEHGARLYLLDDPTQGVDVRGRAEIHNLIREACAAGNTVLLASSELEELLELSDTIITIYNGEIVSSMSREEASANRVLAEITHQQALPSQRVPVPE
jgi:ABC-type sugar transport system ATPase subunit